MSNYTQFHLIRTRRVAAGVSCALLVESAFRRGQLECSQRRLEPATPRLRISFTANSYVVIVSSYTVLIMYSIYILNL